MGGDAVEHLAEGGEGRGVGVALDAEVLGEGLLEVEDGFVGGVVGGEVVEGAAEEVVEVFDGGLGFGGGLEEFDEVGGAEDAGPGGLEAEAEVGDGDFAEGVEVGFFGGGPEEVGGVEEV